ncbi:hypothetical protein AB0J14_04985 [Micromonospora arborensis]|uniref:hypothetical protein n=1 Tax=Micromonospora arborensis TaxID=2116518 RepID=UPI0033C4E257
MGITDQRSPDLVVVVDGGDTLTVVCNGQASSYERAKLETAWLLRLEHTNPMTLAAALRIEHGFSDAIRYAKAADVLVRAGVNI